MNEGKQTCEICGKEATTVYELHWQKRHLESSLPSHTFTPQQFRYRCREHGNVLPAELEQSDRQWVGAP